MNRKRLTGSALKIIAIVSMLIDHIGTILLTNGIIMKTPYHTFSDQQFAFIMTVSRICNMIGRLAFPIFCFLLVEGFIHTHNLKKYFRNLMIFALVTEPIYDLVFGAKLVDWSRQNVLFTLSLGLITLIIIKKANNNILVASVTCVISSIISYYLFFDGWYYGIILITIFYMFKESARLKFVCALVCIYLCGLDYTLSALVNPGFLLSASSLLLIACYNGKRGINLKYYFYLFYPVHLLLLYLLSLFIVNLLA